MPADPLDTDVGDMDEPYDDLDLMPFGKYVNTPLQDVPASYFHWLWTECRPLRDKRLEKYIIKSMSALKEEYPNGIWR